MSNPPEEQQLGRPGADSRIGIGAIYELAKQPVVPTLQSPEHAVPCPSNDNALHQPSFTHTLLLLSDSALPLGSFAFSSGLESYIAHHKPLAPNTSPITSFYHFLNLSISTLASTALPYILAAYRHPEIISSLDDEFDASTPCTVARRASIAQGKALLSVWERAFRGMCNKSSSATAALVSFSALLKAPRADPSNLGANGHFAPLWSLVCRSMDLPLSQTAYIFLFNHAKAVLSAAVRASVMGPYQAQGVLASGALQEHIRECGNREWETQVEDAGQVVPVMDLWIGRHELLYSRIFNS
ncbi:hypothetical protein MMC16_000574 [Acarospora aff. strigata]|nr:hypothetical protein [Acarospora aff. strigata]